MRNQSASGTGAIDALAPRPTAGSLTGKRTVGSAPARGTGARDVAARGAAGFFGVVRAADAVALALGRGRPVDGVLLVVVDVRAEVVDEVALPAL